MVARNVLFFFIGAFISGLGVIYYYESRDDGFNFEPQDTVELIEASAAETLIQNYRSNIPGDKIWGYNISLEELEGIKRTIRETGSDDISGFKLLKGLDEENPESRKSFLVYPIDKKLYMKKPEKVYKVWGFNDNYVLPCPDFCDSPKSLPITFDR